MVKVKKNIWKIISYPLIYLGVQLVVTVIYILAAIMPDIFKMSFENARTGKVIDEGKIYDLVLSVNFMMPVLISAVIAFLIIFIIQRKEWKAERFWSFAGFKISPFLLCLILGAALNILTVCIISFLPISPESSPLDDLMGKNFMLEFITVALVGPILEEIIFRGVVHKYMDRLMSRHAAVFLQALIFGFIHLNITQGIYAFFLGVIIGYIYLWFDSIYVAIAVHVAFNGTNIALLYLFGDSEIDLLYFLITAVIGFIASMAGITFLANKKASEKQAYLKSGYYNRWQF